MRKKEVQMNHGIVIIIKGTGAANFKDLLISECVEINFIRTPAIKTSFFCVAIYRAVYQIP